MSNNKSNGPPPPPPLLPLRADGATGTGSQSSLLLKTQSSGLSVGRGQKDSMVEVDEREEDAERRRREGSLFNEDGTRRRVSTSSSGSRRIASTEATQTSNISIPIRQPSFSNETQSISPTLPPSLRSSLTFTGNQKVPSTTISTANPSLTLILPLPSPPMPTKPNKVTTKSKPSPPSKNVIPLKVKDKVVISKKTQKIEKSRLKANYSILISGTESESEASSVDSDSIRKIQELNENECTLFDAVSSGSIVTVKELLEFYRFDFNNKNIVGYTILHIAIRRQDEEMVKLILFEAENKLWPSVLEDTLLHAIKETHVDLVRTILAQIDSRGIKTRKEALRRRKILKNYLDNVKLIKEEEEFVNSEFSEDMTPLLLSALCDSYELVELFHDRGHILRKPHVYFCKCEECEEVGPLRRAYRRLHAYQACCKPAYMCYMTNQSKNSNNSSKTTIDDPYDPILVAFNLIKKVKECGDEEVFKPEYLAIADELQQFTCDILQQCRRTVEVEVLLEQREGYSEASPYPRFSMAIDMKLKNFVAHQHCQQIMYRYWAGNDWPEWRAKGVWSLILNGLIRIPTWPIIALWMCIERKSALGRLLATPASCCLSKVISYFFFLSFIFVVNVWNPDGPDHRGLPRTGVEYVILAWIAGFWLSILAQLVTRFKSYLSNPWATYDILNNSLFIAAFICWWCTPEEPDIQRQHWSTTDPTLIAEIIFTVASTMAYGRMMRMFQLSPRIGPLITAVGEMIFDIFSVLLFFCLIIFAYSMGLSRLYGPYKGWVDIDPVTQENISQSEAFSSLLSSLETLYWGIFSMSSTSDTNVIPRTIVSVRNASLTSTNHLSFTQSIGKTIHSSYHIVVTTILLNMLLGLMSRTYELVNENVDAEWKFTRSQIWLSYGLDFVNPSPLNFIPPLSSCFGLCKKQKPNEASQSKSNYHKLAKVLIQRYFRDKAEFAMREPATTEVVEALEEDIAEFKSLLEQADTEHYEKRKNSVYQRPMVSLEQGQGLQLPTPSPSRVFAKGDDTIFSDQDASDQSDAYSVNFIPRTNQQPVIPHDIRILKQVLSSTLPAAPKSNLTSPPLVPPLGTTPFKVTSPEGTQDSTSRNVHF